MAAPLKTPPTPYVVSTGEAEWKRLPLAAQDFAWTIVEKHLGYTNAADAFAVYQSEKQTAQASAIERKKAEFALKEAKDALAVAVAAETAANAVWMSANSRANRDESRAESAESWARRYMPLSDYAQSQAVSLISSIGYEKAAALVPMLPDGSIRGALLVMLQDYKQHVAPTAPIATRTATATAGAAPRPALAPDGRPYPSWALV